MLPWNIGIMNRNVTERPMMPQTDAQTVETIIKDFIAQNPANTLKNKADDKAFGSPLVGFASGDDLLFEQYKDHVGPFYMTPWEVFAVTFRDMTIKPEQLTVISYILP